MKTVLGFDSWTGGAAKFARLVPAMRDAGYRLILLHIGSWGGDPGRQEQEWLDDLEIRDISYYGGKRMEEILDMEKPAAVLFLSVDVFAHRAFNRFSRQRGIPTVHLYHGLVGVQATNKEKLYKVNFVNQTGYVLSRVPKALRHIWPCYARALLRTGAGWNDWRRFVSDIVDLTRGRYIARAAPDSRTSAACVYTGADVPHAVGKYGHDPKDVHVVGNPDISAFGLTEVDLGVAARSPPQPRTEVVYIDTGLIYAGMVFDDADDFLQHLITTRDALLAQGFSLAVKLHPQHIRTDFPNRLVAAHIEVLDNQSFVPRLKNSAAAIVEPSTAALIPAIIGLPVMLAQFGKLTGQDYGQLLVEYPRARHLDSPDALTHFLATEAHMRDDSLLSTWISRNSGPLPADLMPSRVVQVVLDSAL